MTFTPIERGHMSEGGLSDRNSPKAIFVGGVQMSSHDGNVPSGGIDYPPVAAEPGIYTGLHDDYDTLFEARHGRVSIRPCTCDKLGGSIHFLWRNNSYPSLVLG